MDFRQLKHFLAAAETGNFSKAAEREFVSQPALSASIGKLERDLSSVLFLRTKRGVSLTADGHRLLQTARLVVHECARTRAELRGQDARGRVRIGAIDTLAMPLIKKFVDTLNVRHPEISVEIQDGSLTYIDRLLRETRIDLAIKAQPAGARVRSADKSAFDLFREPFVLLAPSSHPLRFRKTVSMEDLDGERFVARMHCELAAVISKLMKKAGIRVKSVCRTHQDERAASLVAAGYGIAIAPASIAIHDGVKLPLSEPGLSRVIRIERSRAASGPIVSQVVSLARSGTWVR